MAGWMKWKCVLRKNILEHIVLLIYLHAQKIAGIAKYTHFSLWSTMSVSMFAI